jgi:hypothetical protein
MNSRPKLLFAIFVALSCAITRAEDPPLKFVQSIPLEGVEGRIDHLAADVERKTLFIAALGNNSVEVIDLAASKRIASLTGMKKPAGVRVVPGSHRLIVASGEDGVVRVYDERLTLLGRIDGLDDADNVRVDADGKLVYVGYGEGALAVIDPEQIKKVGDIKLDSHPESFQLESKAGRIFVNVPGARHVAVVDRDKAQVVAKWALDDAASNFPMALDEANHRLFIGCRKPAKLIVLDADSGKQVASLPCCGDADDVFFDPTTHRIYITGGEGAISVIACEDADHYHSLSSVVTARGARTSLFVPELQRLYVAVPHRDKQPAEIRVFEATPPTPADSQHPAR